MKPQIHAVTGFGGGLLLCRFWGDIKSIFFFLGSTLIDSDHSIDFMWRSKCKSLNIIYIVRATYAFIEAKLRVLPNRKDTLSFFIFHSVEFLIAVGTLGVFLKSSVLVGIFWGALLHILLDIVYVRKKKIRRAWSLIEFLVKRHLMRRRGIDPDAVFKEILKEMQQSPKRPE